MKTLLLLTLPAFFLSSCLMLPCNPTADAILVDDISGLPIEDAIYHVYDGDKYVKTDYTDSTGMISSSGLGTTHSFLGTEDCEKSLWVDLKKEGYNDTVFIIDTRENGKLIRLKK